MSDTLTTVAQLKDAVKQFADARNWGPYHSPKNLVLALMVEVAELAEHFLWIDEEESRRVASAGSDRREDVADELADVAGLILQFSIQTDIDLSTAIRNKLNRNETKYPASSSSHGDE